MAILDFFAYKWKYLPILIKDRTKNRKKQVESIAYVTHSNTENWILGAKARRLSRNSSLKSSVVLTSTFKNYRDCDGYFFLHPNIFAKSIQKNPDLLRKKNIVMFTHPVLKSNFSIRHRVFVLNKADKVIFLNNEHANLLIKHGLNADKVEIMHLASNAEMFQPHERKAQKICMSMACYERKNPLLMLELIRKMPHRNFLLIGPQWESFMEKHNLHGYSNFEHHNPSDFKEYPELYKQCDVFLSTSSLEGGPVPLLETMLCNMVPVTTKTGYCTDIIEHGKNGYLFNINASAEEVIPLIEAAYELKTNTRESVINYTWENYSAQIDKLFKTIA